MIDLASVYFSVSVVFAAVVFDFAAGFVVDPSGLVSLDLKNLYLDLLDFDLADRFDLGLVAIFSVVLGAFFSALRSSLSLSCKFLMSSAFFFCSSLIGSCCCWF